MEEKHHWNRREQSSSSEFCLKNHVGFGYAWQTGVRIFPPFSELIRFILGVAHLAQILNPVVGLDAVNVVDLLGEAMMHEEEHQPVLPQPKPFSPEIHQDVDIAFALMNHAWILAVPFPVDHLSRRCIISVCRDYVRLQRFLPFWT